MGATTGAPALPTEAADSNKAMSRLGGRSARRYRPYRLAVLHIDNPFEFAGRVEWLRSEEGGRTSGPPTALGQDCAATAYVEPGPPVASFVLRGWSGEWSSSARGTWFFDDNPEKSAVEPGAVILVQEGPRVVARFRVESVDA